MSDPLAPLPPPFVERLRSLEAALDAPLAARLGRRHPAFRVESRRVADQATLLAGLAGAGVAVTPIPGLDAAFAVPPASRDALTRSDVAEVGSIYIQGAASQRAARALGALPGERVLDLAAAPGGKTLAVAAAMQDSGRLVANEPIRARFHRLQANLERAGATFVETISRDGRRLPRDWHAGFDRVLLDAPCSSEARIDPERPASFAKWSLGKIRDMARKQWGLLGAALDLVVPGGVVLYCTCSLAPEENEANVAAWLDRAEVLDVDLGPGVDVRPGLTAWGKKRWPDEVARSRRIVPDDLHESLFVALLRRRTDDAGREPRERGSRRGPRPRR